MATNPYAPLRVTQVGNPSFKELVSDDLFAIVAKISSADPFYTFSIHAPDTQVEDPKDPHAGSADTFSLWARYSHGWRFVVIGAVSLSDIFFELVDVLQAGKAEEIRICPPGCPEPARLP